MLNNLDIGLELQKIRGGSLCNNMNMYMYMKYDCLNNQHRPQCRWIKNLKYYVYSAHDTTVYAFLSVFGIAPKVVVAGGYPDYTAATFVELWMNKTDGEPYFKMLYRTSDVNNTIYPVTHFINGCDGKDYCKLDVFQSFATRSKPDRDMNEASVPNL
ncbi:unnamed protein product [Strongylus vulgaris]|uniref:acid phosphatase n=1 Tax=Strongylus vulgaris TaxID=40348 RepID=A0A3P7LFY8_STRVU|nr:unnamed protein product [Strongylus vulgaris]